MRRGKRVSEAKQRKIKRKENRKQVTEGKSVSKESQGIEEG